MQNDKTPTVKVIKPRRRLAKEIRRMLADGKGVLYITTTLECHPSAVYFHKKRLAGGKHRDSLDDKIKRFNRKNGSELVRDFVIAATEMRCAFSGQLIDAERDSFYLGTADGLPILYLPEYHRLAKIGLEEHLARCKAVLEKNGIKVGAN